MILSQSFSNLRRILQADAVLCVVSGLLLSGGSSLLGPLLNIPNSLLFYSGLILFPIALFIGVTAQRPNISRAAVWAIVAVNTLWVLESFAILLLGWVTPNAFGTAFVVVQAIVVALFAGLQYLGLQRRQL
mgnify:CR=1 FL=1|jgi:hypothetical protein